MEEEAGEFNSTTGPRKIGGKERGEWRERTLEILSHEVGHVEFRASFASSFQNQFSGSVANLLGKPRRTCRTDEKSQVNVFKSCNELTAMVQELPLRMERIATSAGLSDEGKEQELKEWRDHRMRGKSQAIPVSLNVIRCLCGCEDANDLIRETVRFATSSWSALQRNQLDREMNDPQWSSLDLRWPNRLPPTPDVPRPGP
jgi:hypothetical protein